MISLESIVHIKHAIYSAENVYGIHFYPEIEFCFYFEIVIIFYYRKKYIFVAVLTKPYNHARHCNKSKKNHC